MKPNAVGLNCLQTFDNHARTCSLSLRNPNKDVLTHAFKSLGMIFRNRFDPNTNTPSNGVR